MHYLHVFGFLVILAVSGSTLDHELSTKGPNAIYKPAEEQDPGLVNWWASRMSLNPLREHSRPKEQNFTPFEKRVIRILRKHGLLKSETEKVLDKLENDKELLRKLKKLLDEVDAENETDDFYEDFWDLLF
ncbi:uncharacterized protein LOC119557810 [Drosophila subpulchrella]|uniref:uncharacterized protein LOC119557810 n=1 Tax=Drosophila subpulchrella TaxID=1486046 RepID=UPI0018A16CFC|nr:uncharacterized protein LOC119557810 [Drosophila subpulchrella]